MDIKISFKVNEAVFLRDPEKSELGRSIIKNSIDLINNLGFEAFTFKKLAIEMGTTEASIYRYFENKHRLLLYIISWYWKYMDFLLDFQLQNLTDQKIKLKTIIKLLTHELPINTGDLDYNIKFLNQIVITESSKVYLVKEVTEINKSEVFKPYKELCAKIAAVVSAYNKKYAYPKSLSSTIIEASHHQQFFSQHLPRLTDVTPKNKNEFAYLFIENMVFGLLGK
jgi:AcrR family transcriptional regulator